MINHLRLSYEIACVLEVEELETVPVSTKLRTSTIDRLKKKGAERGTALRSSLKGRERANVNQTKTGNVSKAALGKHLRDRVEHIRLSRAPR